MRHRQPQLKMKNGVVPCRFVAVENRNRYRKRHVKFPTMLSKFKFSLSVSKSTIITTNFCRATIFFLFVYFYASSTYKQTALCAPFFIESNSTKLLIIFFLFSFAYKFFSFLLQTTQSTLTSSCKRIAIV